MAKADVTYRVSLAENSVIIRALEQYAEKWREAAEAIADISNPDRQTYMKWSFEAQELLRHLRGK